MSAFGRIYKALFVASFQQAAQYRIQGLLWLLFAFVRPVIFLAAWSAAAAAQGGAIGGFTAGDFAAYYIANSLVIQLGRSWDVWDFEFEVRQGRLSPKLLRPLHPVHYSLVGNLVYKLTTLPVLLPALTVLAWTFHAHFQTQPWHVVLFIPSMFLAAALQFLFGWLLATSAFWTTRIHAITTVFDRLAFVFAGQIAPVSLMPAPLESLAYVLPFAYFLWVPSGILSGVIPVDQAVVLVFGQAVWVAVVWLAFTFAWRLGLRQYSAVGA